MFIKSIRLKNGYKRFKDLTIDLGDTPPRIVALVGPNGCGKSSVFDGILFLHNSHHLLGSTNRENSRYHSLFGLNHYDYSNIEIAFTDGSYPQIYHRKYRTGEHQTIFSFRSPYRYNPRVMVSQTTAVSEIRLNDYGASTTIGIDSRMEDNYRRLLAQFSKYRDDEDLRPSEARAHIIGQLNMSLRNCLDLEIDSLGDIQASRGTILCLFRNICGLEANFSFQQ